MKTSRISAQSRQRLDERFREIGPISRFSPPVYGWIKAVRRALGMSTTQLASRLGVKQPSLVALEQSEVKGSISLGSLRRVAAALDCQVVYALVPNKPLEAMVRDRARVLVLQALEPVEHTMLLENQSARGKDIEARTDEIVRESNPRVFWE